MTERIAITIMRHGTTGLLAAVSDDLRGLLVVGRTLEEVMTELPPVMEGLIRAQRNEDVHVLGVEIDQGVGTGWVGYEPRKAVATVEMQAA